MCLLRIIRSLYSPLLPIPFLLGEAAFGTMCAHINQPAYDNDSDLLYPPPTSRPTAPLTLQEFVDFVAGELEEDLWQRVASDLVGMQRGVARGSTGRGGVVRAFVADLSRSVDGREVMRNIALCNGPAYILTRQLFVQDAMLSFDFVGCDTRLSKSCHGGITCTVYSLTSIGSFPCTYGRYLR